MPVSILKHNQNESNTNRLRSLALSHYRRPRVALNRFLIVRSGYTIYELNKKADRLPGRADVRVEDKRNKNLILFLSFFLDTRHDRNRRRPRSYTEYVHLCDVILYYIIIIVCRNHPYVRRTVMVYGGDTLSE